MASKKKSTAPVTDFDTVEETLDETSLVLDNSVIPVNSNQTFGVKYLDRLTVALYERTLYTEDTVLEVAGKTYPYKAGDYGPWKLSARPYQPTLSAALRWVTEWMTADKLTEAGDMAFLGELLEDTKNDIVTAILAAGIPNRLPSK